VTACYFCLTNIAEYSGKTASALSVPMFPLSWRAPHGQELHIPAPPSNLQDLETVDTSESEEDGTLASDDYCPDSQDKFLHLNNKPKSIT
jgi:hypothetical protein